MLKYLLEKEFKQFIRNSFLPRLVIMMPFMATLIFPLVANFDVKDIRISIIDHDQSTYSHQLIEKIKSSGYFNLQEMIQNDQQGLNNIESKNTDIVIEIPINFEKRIIRGEKQIKLLFMVNAVNGIRGGLGSGYLSQIIRSFSDQIKPQAIEQQGGVELLSAYWYNPTLAYPMYMIPAIMIMVLSMISGFLPALNIVGEKQNGTMEQINVTPIKKSTFILSKLIPYWVVGLLVLTVCMIVSILVYDLYPQGSLLTLYLFVGIFILGYSGFGLVISNYATTVQQAMFMMFFFVITFVFMSGLYTPVENMPQWAQYLSDISPLKYMMSSMRGIYLKGSSLMDLKSEFISLVIIALFFNIWAVLSYQKKTG
ncbi:MAG: ABC transporter permease [Flavobacteriaceae bacterium]